MNAALFVTNIKGMRPAHAALAAALAVTVPLGNDGLPDGMLGVWTPIQTDESPQAILGPMASGWARCDWVARCG